MEIRDHGKSIVEIVSDKIVIEDSNDMMNLVFETNAESLILRKENLHPEFFRLASGIAGDIYQKCTNYRIRLAITGDFSGIESKPLNDLIFESNQGSRVIFVESADAALEKFS